MHKSSLSQDVGKRTNGKRRIDASVTDINARSHTRYHSDTGSAYTVVNSTGLIKVEFSQTGNHHDAWRVATVGEMTTTGFRSYSAIEFLGHKISWEDLADLIGMSQESLMRTVAKFARSQPCRKGGISSRDKYVHSTENRRKRDRAKRQMKSIRIC